jgi:hypothetical protein
MIVGVMEDYKLRDLASHTLCRKSLSEKIICFFFSRWEAPFLQTDRKRLRAKMIICLGPICFPIWHLIPVFFLLWGRLKVVALLMLLPLRACPCHAVQRSA